jgi:TolB-like protein
MTAAETLPIVRDIAAALEAAHGQGVIHRDLKSSNVMLVEDKDGSPRAVLTDFGLARSSFGEAGRDEAVAGTPDYMAPEQFAGRAVGPAADLFAFGVVMYEMRTGKRPFANSSTMTGAARRAGGAPNLAHIPIPDLEARWKTAILRCLEHDPAKRYERAADVPAAIEGPRTRLRVSRRAALAGLGILGSGLWIWKPWASRSGMRVSSLAVLPFQPLAPDRETEELSRGLAEELIRTLGGIPGLKVVRNSNPDRRNRPVREIGKILNVAAVLSGGLRRDAGRVTVTAQLTSMADGEWLWSGRFDETDEFLTRLRVNLCLAIAGAVAPRLSRAQLAGLGGSDQVNAEAYNLYLRARYHTSFRLESGLKTSIEYLSQSIAADPSFAPAHALLSEVYNMLAGHRGCPQDTYFDRSEKEADRALALDSTLAEAHVAKGLSDQRFRWDWDGAERHFREAIRLNDGLAAAHHRYAGFSSNLGLHDIALAEIQRAVALDPYSPIIQTTYGALLYRARRFDDALAQYETTRRMFESFAMARAETADSLGAKGLWEQAVAMYRDSAANGSPEDAGFVHALGRAGHLEEARRRAQELESTFPEGCSAVGLAVAYRGLGDWDKMFHWFDVAVDRHETGLLTVKVDPANDPIRSDPRFSKLLARLRL